MLWCKHLSWAGGLVMTDFSTFPLYLEMHVQIGLHIFGLIFSGLEKMLSGKDFFTHKKLVTVFA
jgi:hypothetical protein